MVFQWFWGLATIGNDGFRWFSTIGPTMEWLPTIVEVYPFVTNYAIWLNKGYILNWPYQQCWSNIVLITGVWWWLRGWLLRQATGAQRPVNAVQSLQCSVHNTHVVLCTQHTCVIVYCTHVCVLYYKHTDNTHHTFVLLRTVFAIHNKAHVWWAPWNEWFGSPFHFSSSFWSQWNLTELNVCCTHWGKWSPTKSGVKKEDLRQLFCIRQSV